MFIVKNIIIIILLGFTLYFGFQIFESTVNLMNMLESRQNR